ncbi:hypothetical protein SVAN01_02209 [Stagonosporopsis vannaccii]|nr:hypothetical protein SVAN01_02209 [Stagonosporopsis vannaccii]
MRHSQSGTPQPCKPPAPTASLAFVHDRYNRHANPNTRPRLRNEDPTSKRPNLRQERASRTEDSIPARLPRVYHNSRLAAALTGTALERARTWRPAGALAYTFMHAHMQARVAVKLPLQRTALGFQHPHPHLRYPGPTRVIHRCQPVDEVGARAGSDRQVLRALTCAGPVACERELAALWGHCIAVGVRVRTLVCSLGRGWWVRGEDISSSTDLKEALREDIDAHKNDIDAPKKDVDEVKGAHGQGDGKGEGEVGREGE